MTDTETRRELFRRHPDSVLFVTSQLRARELKLAWGLRRQGWKVGLVYFAWTPFEPGDSFDFGISVSSAEEAHRCASELSPRICHVFSGAIDELILAFCRDKPCPVVIDLNDVFAPSLFDYCHERFEPTREALSLADGFCARDLQVRHAHRADRFPLPPRMIFFPEYCWNVPVTRDAGAVPASEAHVVSVGTFSLETQGMYDSCYLELVRMFAAQQIHFHIYPHWSYRKDHAGSPHVNFARDFEDFLALERSSPYVHVHDSLSTAELARVLPRYDFGIVSGGCEEFGQKLRFYKPAYLETCYSGRIADYLDARLPVMCNEEVRFDFRMLRRYGACVDLKRILRPGFKAFLLEAKQSSARAGFMRLAAEKLSVDTNTPRLVAFYSALQEGGRARTGPATAAKPKTRSPDAEGAAPGIVPGGGFWAALRRGVRWLSPRAAKLLLPYRAIRIFEFRLHNALQDNARHLSELEALRHRLSATFQELSSAQSLADRSRGQASALRVQLAAAEAGRAQAQSTTEETSRTLEDTRARLDRSQQTVADLTARVANLNVYISNLSGRAADLERARSVLLEDMAGLARAKAEAEVALADSKREQSVTSETLLAMAASRAEALANSEILAYEKQELSRRLGGLQDENSRLRQRSIRFEQLADYLQSRTDELADSLRAALGPGDMERFVPFAEELIRRVDSAAHRGPEGYEPLDEIPKVLLACMPKSGSTWLTNVMAENLDLAPFRCYLEADRNEQEIDPLVLFRTWGRRALFVQQHIRYSRVMLSLCRAFSTKVVVLTRHLDDVVVSLRDHVEKESPECSMFYTEAEWFARRDPEAQIDFIIDHAMPWYLNFYVGWRRAMERHPEQILHVTYEEMVRDNAGCMERISRFYGTEVPARSQEDLDLRVGTRFNHGRPGRGRETLTRAQRKRLERLAGYYSGSIDFGPVGL